MKAIAATLAALAVLSGCAARQPKLAWTAQNVQTVAKKCDLAGLTVDSRGIAGGGLHQIGKEPPIDAKYRCLERRIDLPPGFFLVTG